jgi:tRNA (mo5U34)-methyltransferase
LAKSIIDSKVDWRPINVYDLDPAEIGTFDVVVMGSLLIHLRDPVRALEAVRRVTSGYFLSSDQIEPGLTMLSRRKPLYTLHGSGGMCQWFNYNGAGHERLLFAAGFEIVERSKPYMLRFNVHPKPVTTVRSKARHTATTYLTGSRDHGVLHQGLLTRPRV